MFRSIPTITSLSTNQGGPAGQHIIIKGGAFGTDKSQLEVKLAGQPCTIVNLDFNKIECVSKPGQAPTDNYFANASGIRYELFDLEGLSLTDLTAKIGQRDAG